MDKKESEKIEKVEEGTQKDEKLESANSEEIKETASAESTENIQNVEDTEKQVEEKNELETVTQEEPTVEDSQSNNSTSKNIQSTDTSTTDTSSETNSKQSNNTEISQKKSSKAKVIVVIVLAVILCIIAFFGLGDKKEELPKTKYDQNYNYSMTQEVQEFNIKVTGKYKKDDVLYYQCDVTPKDDKDNKFKVESVKKPTDKKIIGAKYVYTVSYPKHEEKQYFYYETEYGNSVSDKKIQQFNSTKYIDKYYDEHFVEPSKK